MSDDLIRRSDVIKFLNDYLDDCYRVSRRKYEKTMLYAISMDFEAVITNIPAVEPKKGEWKAYKYMQPPEFHGKHYCSNCYHAIYLASNGNVYNYCPKCGARMKGADNEIN